MLRFHTFVVIVRVIVSMVDGVVVVVERNSLFFIIFFCSPGQFYFDFVYCILYFVFFISCFYFGVRHV
jgi:hypothetical protein